MNKRSFGITPEQFEEFNNMTSGVPDMTAVTSEPQSIVTGKQIGRAHV